MNRFSNALISCTASLIVTFLFILFITGTTYFSDILVQAYRAILITCAVAFSLGLLLKNQPLTYSIAIGSIVGILSGLFFVYVAMFNI